jgi:hypothetical protein
MRYLTLAAEYTGSPLRDDFTGTIVREDVGLSAALRTRIGDWNDRYRVIIPLSTEQRLQVHVAEMIAALDTEGAELVAAVEDALHGAKVRYYSEGLLRFL